MAKKRAKKVVVSNISSEQFEEALSAYAFADARETKVNATMDEQITKIREKFADELSDLKQLKENNFETVQTYCTENQEVLFGKKKSYETTHGAVGFRTGTHKLKTRKGFTWESVLVLLKKLKPDYVRTKEEPNKELLLADRDKLKAELPDLGVEVGQDETFFIELKKEEAVQ